MPALRVVESGSAAERLAAARAFVEALPPATEALIVGASRRAADDLAREVSAARGATFGLHRLSLVQLARRFAGAALARLGRAPITALGAEALAARVAFEAVGEGALPYFGPVAACPGFAPALAATLGELRRAGVSAVRVEAAGGAAAEVAGLLRRYEERLEGDGLADHAALFRLAAEAAAEGALDSLRRMPMLLLDVAIASAAERDFVAALTAVAPAVLATVPAGDDATRAALAALGAPAAARTAPGAAGRGGDGTGRAPGSGGDAAGGADEGDLARLRRYLFAEQAPPETAPRGDVVFFSAPGEGREAVEIARLVLEHARAGVPFDRMAVLLRAPGTYWGLLETALARAGIPAFFTRGARRPDPAGRAFLALLECARERLSARRFAEYLSLGQVPRLDPGAVSEPGVWVEGDDEMLLPPGALPGEARADEADGEAEGAEADAEAAADAPVQAGTLRAPWKWEALLVESAVIGGRDRWERRLRGLAREYRLRLEALRRDEPESPRIAGVERDLANLEHLARFALPVIDRLAALPRSAPWSEWLPALEALAPVVLRRPERVLAVLAELRPLAPVGPVTLDEVRDVLAARLAALDRRPPADRYGRLFVGPVEEARGRAFDVVFLPGLAERVFPRKPREDPLLLDALRRRLDAGLETQRERGQRERLLLRLAAGAATRRLYLSYARLDLAVARPRVPSFYALEVRRALTGRIPDPERLARDANEAARARLAWPAPEDPARAIDEEEHDLATLAALLRAPADTTRGRARYLLDLNPALARSLRARYARWEMRRWLPQDGIVRVADGTREALAAASLRARAYSVSALQRFAVCPYQFFLSAICRLEPREEIAPLERLDPATRGQLFHEVQAETLRALAAAGALPLEEFRLPEAMRVLDDTLARVADAYREELAPAIERVWRAEIESMRVDLRVWLEQCVAIQAVWEPVAFELAFGLPPSPGHDPRSVAAEAVVAGFRLRGIVDLIERRRGGTDLRVTDYKTGGRLARWNVIVGGGETLQPVLYSLAAEVALGQRVTEGRLYYCTREGGFAERVVRIDDRAREAGREVLAGIDRAVTEGLLMPAPRERACDFCDFREVCGPSEERRVRTKDPGPLAIVTALRQAQ